MENIKNIIKIGGVMLILDYIYLTTTSNHFNKIIKDIQGSEIKLKILPAIICYSLLVFALYYFIIKEKKPLLDAFLLGIIIYGVYDATNMAILDNWTWETLFLDTFWGGFLFIITYYIYKLLM